MLTEVRVYRGKLVDVFAGVLGVGDTKAELEIKGLEQLVPEEVTFDHAELVDRPAAHSELDPGARKGEERGI